MRVTRAARTHSDGCMITSNSIALTHPVQGKGRLVLMALAMHSAVVALACTVTAQPTIIQDRSGIEARWAAQALFDAQRGRLLVQGGVSANQSGTFYPATTMEFDGLNWMTSAAVTSPRAYGAMAETVTGRGQSIVFGGRNAQGNILGDTLIWDSPNNRYSAVSPAASPSPRHSHAMVYDSTRKRTVLFGGVVSASGTQTGDVWEWDGATWRSFASVSSPRSGHAMVHHAKGGWTLIYGGEANGNLLGGAVYWDGGSFSYGPAAPGPRKFHAMAYDSIRQRAVLFGGIGTSGVIGDTWEWDGIAWYYLTPAHKPEPRFHHSMVWNPQRKRVQLFGGETTTFGGPFSDVWEFDGVDWTYLPPAGSASISPTIDPRRSHAAAYLGNVGRMVVFGGNRNGTALGDTWVNDGKNSEKSPIGVPAPRWGSAYTYHPALSGMFMFSGIASGTSSSDNTLWKCDGKSWSPIATGANKPVPRGGGALAYDSARSKLVLFGGYSPTSGIFADTWEYSNAVWSYQLPAMIPTFRAWHAMAYDPIAQRIVMFGGQDRLNAPLGDTWIWDGTNWSQTAPIPALTPRYGHVMMFDPVRGKIILFGGQSNGTQFTDTWEWSNSAWNPVNANGQAPTASSFGSLVWDTNLQRGVYFGGKGPLGESDVIHEWNGATATWSIRASSTPISARQDHVATYDRTRRVMLVFGGTRGSTLLNDTWEWDGRSWKARVPLSAPSPRSAASMAVNPVTLMPTLFGGITSSGLSGESFQYDGVNWVMTSNVPAEARYNHVICEGPGGLLAMFGGRDSSGLLGNLHLFSSGNWGPALVQTQPPAREAHGMAFDKRRNVVVLYGGLGSAGLPLNDTWELSVAGGFQYTWTKRTSATTPPARTGPEMTFDESRGRVVMTGGYLSNGTTLNDVWEWNGIEWIQRTAETIPMRSVVNHSLVYDPYRARCIRFGGFDWTSEYAELYELFSVVDIIGKGHVSGGVPLVALSQPVVGQLFRLWFDNPMNVASLMIGLAPSPEPVATLTPPLFCSVATIWLNPVTTTTLSAIPSDGLAIPVPANSSMVGGLLSFQVAALQPTSCLLASDALNVRVVLP